MCLLKRFNFRIIFNSLLILFLIFCFSCGEPGVPGGGGGGGEDDPPVDTTVPAPKNVRVEMDDDAFLITWEEADGITNYVVYRKEGVSGFESITPETGNLLNDTEYEDDEFSDNTNIQYAVRSEKDGKYSEYSTSNIISKNVQEVKASKLDYDNKIVVSWIEHPMAESYNVYRYLSENEDGKVNFDGVGTVAGEKYEFTDYVEINSDSTNDVILEERRPYYYRVTWVKKNEDDLPVEYGLDAPLAMGVYSVTEDFGESDDPDEDNDNYTYLIGSPFSSICDEDDKPMIYTLDNGEDDKDWYKYYGETNSFTIILELEEDSPLLNNLYIQFYTEEDGYHPEEELVEIIDEKTKYIYYTSFNTDLPDEDSETPGKQVSIYFVIKTDKSTTNIIGSYSFEILNGIYYE